MRTRRLFLFALCGLLSACALTPRVSNTWRANDYAGPALRKLMVVGVGVDGASRRSFEDALTQALQANGVEAIASYSRNVDPPSHAGLPALSLPAGLTSEGLPVGLELVGPAMGDGRLLAVAGAVEAALPPLPPPRI